MGNERDRNQGSQGQSPNQDPRQREQQGGGQQRDGGEHGRQSGGGSDQQQQGGGLNRQQGGQKGNPDVSNRDSESGRGKKKGDSAALGQEDLDDDLDDSDDLGESR